MIHRRHKSQFGGRASKEGSMFVAVDVAVDVDVVASEEMVPIVQKADRYFVSLRIVSFRFATEHSVSLLSSAKTCSVAYSTSSGILSTLIEI